jgi:hypothetical protein
MTTTGGGGATDGSVATGGGVAAARGGSTSGVSPEVPEAGSTFMSSAGTADDPDRGGQGGESIAPSGRCYFEYLGDWIRCEGDNDYPWSRDVVNKSLADCTRACLAQPDCVAVVDYYWMNRPDLGCTLDVSSCSRPGPNEWAEEDHGKEFRKVCN